MCGARVVARKLAELDALVDDRADQDADPDLLYAWIEPSLSSPEFLLQKTIGWALRQYARTDPAAVSRYIRTQGERLSTLSRREALKHIG